MTREDGGASSFDELASGLASGSISRGKALRLMGAALVGGTLASLGIGEAGADDLCKPEGKKCRKDAQCCSGSCYSSSGTCKPSGAGPDFVRCICQDFFTIDTCTSIDCSDGPATDAVCAPFCETHGGLIAVGCVADDAACLG